MFRYLPEQASEHAHEMDWLHHIITDLSVFFTVVIVGAMLYFAIRYRKKDGKDHETPQILGSHFLEAIWTIVPTIICIFIAYEGIRIFFDMKKLPADAITVYATGKQWKWDFEYETGKRTTGEFVVPVNKQIKVVLTSQDVLHSFFVPAMRVKSDAMKGQFTYVSFKPIKTGTYHTFCTEYCGKDHSKMLAELRVVSEDEYARWVNDKAEKEMSPLDRGKLLYSQKGCNACHSLDGKKGVGPSWLKLYGAERKFIGGSSTVADDNYIQESILRPMAKVVEGYVAGAMPAYEGQLSETDLVGLIAFIKSQDGKGAVAAPAAEAVSAAPSAEALASMKPEERGKLIYANGKGAGAPCSSCHSLDGSKLVGPSFKGIYGRQGKTSDGAAYTANDEYIKESILNPSAKIVEGYAGGMIPYQGVLEDSDLNDVIAYMKTLTKESTP
jgi:cytochrome c oxidase subunit 2